jgi:hypothetical protein
MFYAKGLAFFEEKKQLVSKKVVDTANKMWHGIYIPRSGYWPMARVKALGWR